MKTQERILQGLTAATLIAIVAAASADEVSPELQQLRTDSAQDALHGQVLPVLRRVDGPGNAVGLERAMNVVRACGFADSPLASEPKAHDAALFLKTERWFLQVAGEGTRAYFWRSKNDLPRALSGIPYADVVPLARRALENELAPLVRLGPGEDLIPLGRYEGKVGAGTPGGVFTEQVIETVVHFGRTVNGVPIVGPGSRVIVAFDSQRNLVGFDVYWNEYASTDISQETVSPPDLNARLAALERRGALVSHKRLGHVACGYYDAGAVDEAATQLMQPGCVYRYTLEGDGQGSGTLDVAIPAGKSYVAEEGWPESRLVGEGG